MAGPPPVVARARLAVRACLTSRLEQLADDTAVGHLSPRVHVALSGGADSLALLVVTLWVGARLGLETEAVIVDHGLQEGSDRVAERARTQAEQLGARATVLTPAVETGRPGGIEDAARRARHAALERHVEDRGALALLLGHTLDDQAEQVLMGIARGAGPRAVAGMPRSRGVLHRPFLGTGREDSTALGRAETEEICRLHDLDWWEDPMNADEDLLRARVRHRALPVLREVLGEHIGLHLARTADLLRPDVDHLDAQARELLESVRREGGDLREDGDLLLLDVHALTALPDPLRTRVLRDASRIAEQAQREGGGHHAGKSLVRPQVLAIDALVVTWSGQAAVPIPGRIEVARRDGLLVWRRTDP